METTPGKRVRQFREAKKFVSLTAFAEFTGLKVGTLSALEKDKSAPSLETMALLIKAFPDLNMDWLVTGEGAMLKNGQDLRPMPVSRQQHAENEAAARAAEQQPTPGLTSGPATVAEAENVLLREQVLDLRSTVEFLKAELGKFGSSLEAAWSGLQPTGPRAGALQLT